MELLAYSPFDVLGLVPGLFDEESVKSAFKKSIIKVHPDRGGNECRWPTLDHMLASRKFLIDHAGKAIEWYKDFPFTASGGWELGQTADSEQFGQCSECGMITRACQLEDHPCLKAPAKLVIHAQEEHQFETCHYCQEMLPEAELGEHIVQQHACQLCDKTGTVDSLLHHMERRHLHRKDCCNMLDKHNLWICQFCATVTILEGRFDHVMCVHSVRLCKDCPLIYEEDLDDHLRDKHGVLKCPYCGIHHEFLLSHLQATHYLRACEDCTGHTADAQHFKNVHPVIECPTCDRKIVQAEMDCHYISDHGWAKCLYCDLVEPEEGLVEHKSSHRMKMCAECQESMVEEWYNDHLQKEHAYKSCPFCGELESIDALRSHIQEIHYVSVKCPICERWFDKPGLRSHLQIQHALDTSPVTDDDRKECPDCGKFYKALYEHRRRIHGYKVPPRPGFDKRQVYCLPCRKSHSKSNKSRCFRKRANVAGPSPTQ